MRGLKIALIIFVLITLSASASAQSVPFNSGSLMSFPTGFTSYEPTNMFSSGLTGYSPVVSIPSADISSVSPSISDTSLIPAAIGSSANGLSYVPVGSDSGFQWPSSSYNKWTANGVIPPSAYTQSSEPVSVTPTPTPTPDVTQAQKDKALQIAAGSPLCEKYNAYPNESWDVTWQYPYDGHTAQVYPMTGFSDGNSIEIIVDLNTNSIVNSEVVPAYFGTT